MQLGDGLIDAGELFERSGARHLAPLIGGEGAPELRGPTKGS
ncbi:hypothetical protein [Ferrimicrobium sp.]|nr:hypothetical protein [Ferrimicrobium sp.]